MLPVRLSSIVIIRADTGGASHTFSLHIHKSCPGVVLSSCQLFESLVLTLIIIFHFFSSNICPYLAVHHRVPGPIMVPHSW